MGKKYKLKASRAQKRLWYFEQKYPNTELYNIPLEFELEGDFDKEAFSAALSCIVRKHEVLRTSLKEENGQLYQIIFDTVELNEEFMDLSHEQYVEESYKTEHDKICSTLFNFENAPLFTYKIYKLREDAHRIIFVFHHIIMDGWSIEIFMNELSKAYNDFKVQNKIEDEELEIQYSDYSEWLERWLDEGERESKRFLG